MNERIYKSLSKFGGFTIALGIITMVTGITVGVLSIINGAKALAVKKNMMI